MYCRTLAALIAAALMTGCSGQQPAAPVPAATPAPAPAPAEAAPAAEEPAEDSGYVEGGSMRNFAAVQIGPYAVQPMFEEEIEDGHFNIKIVSGGEVKAVRIWVGAQDPGDTMVSKTEPEFDYHHGHVEMPDPIPADAALWIEIETPAGESVIGSTPLKQAE